MTAAERADLARVIRRAALTLPRDHPALTHLFEAHKSLLAHQTNPHPQPAITGRATA